MSSKRKIPLRNEIEITHSVWNHERLESALDSTNLYHQTEWYEYSGRDQRLDIRHCVNMTHEIWRSQKRRRISPSSIHSSTVQQECQMATCLLSVPRTNDTNESTSTVNDNGNDNVNDNNDVLLTLASDIDANRRQDEGTTTTERWISYSQLQEVNHALAFEQLSDLDSKRIESEATESISTKNLDRKVCLVTDVWIFPKSARHVLVDELPLAAMNDVLQPKSWTTEAIRQYYDSGDIDMRLRGMLLSRRALDRDEHGQLYAWISKPALHHLHKISRENSKSSTMVKSKPPRFAIADVFVAGTYYQLDETNIIEQQALSLAQVRGIVKVVYGGAGNMLQSHLLCWDNRNATIASKIPNVVTRENFQLILAGPMTQAQELLMSKRHACNGFRLLEAQKLLSRINVLYCDMEIDDNCVQLSRAAEDISTHLQSTDEINQLIAEARGRQSTVASMNENVGHLPSSECTIVESETILVETVTDRTEKDRLSRGFRNATKGTNEYVARRSSSLLVQNDKEYLERLFPHLLTYGIGGFSTKRHHQYSHRAIVLHYLTLSTNRFAQDPMFKLAMFDYLSTMRIKTGVFFRVGQDPSCVNKIMEISPLQLKIAMTNRSQQRRCWKLGKAFIPAPEAPVASNVLRSVNACASKMLGSNEERESLSNKVDSMTIFYGAPSVFWTLTPNPDCSITCAFWSGHELPNGRPQHLYDCGQHHMPCPSAMAKIIMGNTVIQAQYYRLCCHALIDVLFGWETVYNKPKKNRGIFGYVESLLLPKTQSDWNRLLASEELRSKFERYSASIFAAELPVYNNIAILKCPNRHCAGQLVPLQIAKKYKHLLKSTVPPPLVAECEECTAKYTESQIVSSILENAWTKLDEQEQEISTDEAVEHIRQGLGGLSSKESTSAVQLSRLLLKDQIHRFSHVRSCVKGRTNTKCRYRFFRPLVENIGFNRDNEIIQRRRIGNQYLNTYIPLWRSIFHFNMDARVLWSGNSVQATRYALQYTVKRQTVLDNVAVVEMAFKKRVRREAAMTTAHCDRGIGRLLSLAYSTSGVMEIGGPLATAILFEGEAVTFSCKFEKLVLLEGLNILSNVEVEAVVKTQGTRMYADTSIQKYINRPNCLEQHCWYDFCAWIQRTRNKSSTQSKTCKFRSSSTTDLSHHVLKHRIQFAAYPAVPEIIGPRLPDVTRLGNEDYIDQTELYYRMALLLDHPFRQPTTFLDDNQSAEAYYHHWNPFNDPKTARALAFHQQYYLCLEMARQYREKQAVDGDETDDTTPLDEDILDLTQLREQQQREGNYILIPPDFYEEIDLDFEVPTGSVVQDNERPDIEELLTNSITSTPLPVDFTESLSVSTVPITRAQILKFQTEDHVLTASEAEERIELISRIQSPNIIVEALDQAIRSVFQDPHMPLSAQTKPYASIRNVSNQFNMNEKQHIGFSLIAVPLLSLISGIELPQQQQHVFSTKPIIITGAGGTGKSQIIDAVRAISASSNRPDSIAVVASTGIAAASLNGCTMHSSVGLGINCNHLPKHIESPTDALLHQWAPVLCVIADEVSMIDLAFFGLWEEALRHTKENLDVNYGGLIIVLMFDHCQLRTVKGTPMFKTTTPAKSLTATQDRGRVLYQSINKVIYLTENMRFTDDSEWGGWLQSARLGNWPQPLRSYIASLPSEHNSTRAHKGMIQTISTDNTTRAYVNEAAIQIAVQTLGHDHKVYVIPARFSRLLTPIEMATIRQLPDNKTGHIQPFLHVYIGE